jgi:hypothetical protein
MFFKATTCARKEARMSGTITASSIPDYLKIGSNEDVQIRKFSNTDARTKSDIAYITKQAPKLLTADALLKDYRSLQIVLGAFGMTEHASQTALLKQLMTQDPAAKSSLAQKLANGTFLRFANAVAQFKPSPFTVQANVDAIVKSIGTNNFENTQDAKSPGMADGLYFKRVIKTVTSIPQLMADPKLLRVATSATNMPDQFGSLDYSFQVRLLSKKLSLKDFQNPAFTDKFVTRFLSLKALANNSNSDPTGSIAMMTGTGSAANMLNTLQNQSTSVNVTTLSLFV